MLHEPNNNNAPVQNSNAIIEIPAKGLEFLKCCCKDASMYYKYIWLQSAKQQQKRTKQHLLHGCTFSENIPKGLQLLTILFSHAAHQNISKNILKRENGSMMFVILQQKQRSAKC